MGVNLDICHLVIALEEPQTAIGALQPAGIKISKIHLRAALKTKANREARAPLKHFANVVHVLQVVACGQNGTLKCFRDLPNTCAANPQSEAWRVHCRVQLHTPIVPPFENTHDHLSVSWGCPPKIPASARTLQWKLTPGKSCRRD